MEIVLGTEVFYLLPEKVVFRPLKNQLILSDIHLGKAAHFRKQGIPMPFQSHQKDIDKLCYLLNTWEPSSVLILGDLFHSNYNSEWLLFKSLLAKYPHVQFILTEGNHDILDNASYSIDNLLKVKVLSEDQFLFSHHPLDTPDRINFCGHVHPGLLLTGMAKQSVKLPCFYFNSIHFILPAFGDLTGLHVLEQEANSDYYLIMKDQVVKL